MTDLTVLVALAAAVSFGWSTAAMHHDASKAPAGGPVALLRHVVGQWRWLTGMAASLLGLVLHGVALSIGSLAVVQPLVVTGLVFSFVFRAALDRRWPSRYVFGWACFTAVGLGSFLLAARSTTGSAAPSGGAAAAVLAMGTITAVTCWVTASRVRAAPAGLLLGLGAGVNFGLTAGALKATTAAHSVSEALTSWPLYVLIVLGVSGFLANQLAYRRAPLASSLPILNVANPLVALTFGVVAFHEVTARGPLRLTVEAVSLAVVLAGVFFLARHEEPTPGRPVLAQPATHTGNDTDRRDDSDDDSDGTLLVPGELSTRARALPL